MRIHDWDNFINENVAYAKSILNKQGITIESPEYQDYLKIRSICGNDNGYVGILTKLRFIDNITDFEELESIFNILKESKFDFAKLNKLTYKEILDIFYDQLSGESKDEENYKLIFKDDTYSYYKVYTYNGILKIGSPAWCLKTKSNWDQYQKNYPEQWVVVDNRYKNILLSPENNYLSEYKSAKGWIRFGISIRHNDSNTINFVANSDNNIPMSFSPSNYTYYGVITTVMNLSNNIMKSYHKRFYGCEHIDKGWFKVIDKKKLFSRIEVNDNQFSEDAELYFWVSESYSGIPSILSLNNSYPNFTLLSEKSEKYKLESLQLSAKASKKIFEDYALKSDDILYYGVKFKLGKMTIEEIELSSDFVRKIGKWAIFNRNDNYYIAINMELGDTYNISTKNLSFETNDSLSDPFFFYIDKKTKQINCLNNKSITDAVVKELFAKEQKEVVIEPNEPEIKKKGIFKKFGDFLKGDK